MKTFLISCETENVNHYFSFFRIFIKITLKKGSIFQLCYDLHCTLQSPSSIGHSYLKCPEGIPHHQRHDTTAKPFLHMFLFQKQMNLSDSPSISLAKAFQLVLYSVQFSFYSYLIDLPN
jgi:hypothetical protein